MNRIHLVAIAAMLIVQWQADAAAQEAKKVARPKMPVRAQLRITNGREQWRVGDKIAVAATVTNIFDSDLFIPDWNQPSLKNSPMWKLYVEVKAFPDATEGWHPQSGYGGTARIESSDGERLGAGKTSRAKTGAFVAMLPGKMTIYATFSCRFLGIQRTTEKGLERFHYPYRRATVLSHGEQSITLPAKMSPAMAEEYGRLSETILSDETRAKERLETLGQVARQKHYFAARFVWDIWKKTKDSKVKSAALLHLIDLLEFGTAYQAMPELLDALTDDATPLDARGRMLDVLGKMYLTSKYPGFRIADMAGYQLPEKVHRKALEVIGKLANSPEPALAEKARQILKPGSSHKPPQK